MKNESFDVLVIGGGAAGIMAAITAARQGACTGILEHTDKVGKKILVTGNGKCNYTNLEQGISNYYGNDPAFAVSVFQQFDVNETLMFFKQLGIFPKFKDGYVYPQSGQAASVRDLLCLELEQQKVKLLLETSPLHIKKTGNLFTIKTTEGKEYRAKAIIIASGLYSGQKCGCDGSMLPLITEMGHKIVEIVPALVQLTASYSFFKNLAGVRADASCTLEVDGVIAGTEKGELQFTDAGLSGIVVFQLSRIATRAMKEEKKVIMRLDLMPDTQKETLRERIQILRQDSGWLTCFQGLLGQLPRKLIPVILKEAGISPDKQICKLSANEIRSLVEHIKDFPIVISGSKNFADSQVSAGGVCTSEIDAHTMMSKLHKGLFFAGEVVDLDGKCGGYNLQWAWSSGYVAGLNASRLSKGV